MRDGDEIQEREISAAYLLGYNSLKVSENYLTKPHPDWDEDWIQAWEMGRKDAEGDLTLKETLDILTIDEYITAIDEYITAIE